MDMEPAEKGNGMEGVGVEGKDYHENNETDVEVGVGFSEKLTFPQEEPPETQALIVQSCLKCGGGGDTVLLSRCDKSKTVQMSGQNDHDPSISISPSSVTEDSSNQQPTNTTTSCLGCVRLDKSPRYQRHDPRTSIAPIKKQCKCRDYWGIMLSLASGLASTFGGLIVRHMKDFHPFSLATYRFQGIVWPTLIILLYLRFVRKENVSRSVWPITDKDKLKKFGFTIVRAIVGCLGLYLYFYAIKLIPLADAKVILSCRSVLAIFFARIFLGEKCGIFPVFVSMLAILGVGIISRPPVITGHGSFDHDTLMGTIFATLSMLAATLSMVVLRYLRGVHVGIVTLAFGFWGTLLSLACSATVERLDTPETKTEWSLIVLLAVSAFFSQTAITLAMKYEHAGAVVIVGTTDTIMSFILQYLFLGDKPDTYSIIGAALIILCVTLITFRKWVSSLQGQNPVRRWFWFVLK